MPPFTEADIRAGASAQSFERGSSYYRSSAVANLVRRGNLLTAQVSGSDYEPYDITVTLTDDGDIAAADCSCPYDWGGYCKHIVAVLLTARQGEQVAVKPDLDTLLAGLSEAQLRRIIHALAEDDPALITAIEQEVEWLKTTLVATPAAQAPTAHTIPVDIPAIRREIRKDLRNAESTGGGHGDRYWEYDEAGLIYVDEILGPHRDTAERLLAAGDPAAATEVVTAMIETWAAGIGDLEDWVLDSNSDAFDEAGLLLGALLAEALLSQDFSPEQREQWLARVENWSDDQLDLEIAESALEQWWDYPPLVAAMNGHITEKGAWENAAPDFADELTLARLRILARQGRMREYISLAEAEGQFSLYVNMLARSGQVEKAVAEARQFMNAPTDILALAQVLVEQGQRPAALAIAGHGLGLTGQQGKTELARWTVKLAQEADDPSLALTAAQAAFTSSYELADYQLAERLAGAEWPAVKADLLAQVARSSSYHKVDIYLYEKMLKEAMAEVDRSHFSSDIEHVIQATRAEHPNWGIGKCKQRAESIMDAGKAKDYEVAVGWLRTARDIYLQHNRGAEWRTYLDGLLTTHERKYKLVPMLRGIR